MLFPKLTRVAILSDSDIPGADGSGLAPIERANMAAARAAGLTVQVLKVRGPKPDLETVFKAMVSEGTEALVVLEVPAVIITRKRVAELAAQNIACPTMFWGGASDSGCLLSYGTNVTANIPRMPIFIDRNSRGPKPAETPFEVVQQRELAINLKTARELGLALLPERIETRRPHHRMSMARLSQKSCGSIKRHCVDKGVNDPDCVVIGNIVIECSGKRILWVGNPSSGRDSRMAVIARLNCYTQPQPAHASGPKKGMHPISQRQRPTSPLRPPDTSCTRSISPFAKRTFIAVLSELDCHCFFACPVTNEIWKCVCTFHTISVVVISSGQAFWMTRQISSLKAPRFPYRPCHACIGGWIKRIRVVHQTAGLEDRKLRDHVRPG